MGSIRGIKENGTDNNTACALTFYTRPSATAPSERARIDSSGNFGLAVVPSAWSSSFKALQVNSASLWSTGSDASLTSNAYYDGSNYRYINTSGATRQYHNTNGSISWSTAPSGSAGGVVSFTQAMTLQENGGLQTLNTIAVGNATPSASGAGITFPATQSASSNANTLDDYEEGTWTSAITCGTSGTITVAGTHNTQSYTKIGRQVTVTANLYMSSVSSPVGTVTITGLPFASGSGNGLRSAAAVLGDNLTSSAITSVVGRIMDNSSSLVIGTYNTGTENNAASFFQTASVLYISLTYFV
jgi:hypothetical protein